MLHENTDPYRMVGATIKAGPGPEAFEGAGGLVENAEPYRMVEAAIKAGRGPEALEGAGG